MQKTVELKIESDGIMIDNVHMDSTGKYTVNPDTYLLNEHDMGEISINGKLILCNYDGYNEVVKIMAKQ